MDFSSVSSDLLLILFSVAIVAGFIDTLAGGGGLITMPALIISGVPPLAVLGTNKLQGSMGTATSTYMMLKHQRIRWHDVKYLMLLAFIGSTLGSIAIQFINVEVLSFAIPVVLLLLPIIIQAGLEGFTTTEGLKEGFGLLTIGFVGLALAYLVCEVGRFMEGWFDG